MAEQVRVKNTGLRGVTVADTKISFIDGEKGVLIYRGYRIEELADRSSFMDTAYLLLHGDLPTAKELQAFSAEIKAARQVPDYVLEAMKNMPKDARPMDVLQATVPMLGMADPELGTEERDAAARMAGRLIARMPTLVAAWDRIRNGLEPISPNDTLNHAANFLYMLKGEEPDEETAHDLDICLILHADHTFNASTFACREVVSTRAHIYAGVTAGLGALSGALHGGANIEVMRMLLDLRDESDVPGWVKSRLDQGKRIMGLGHAVYKTDDPRAKYLREMGRRIGVKTGQHWFELSEQIEKSGIAEFEARGKKGIRPNVDFHSAPVYFMMGIPVDLMTPIFAMSRVAGWTSHVIEEVFAEAQGKPALYRPTAEYVGDYCGLTGCEYKPIEERNE